ncbi:MAG TPA: SDR family NAD(P)-dependent oxidoreductase, partial [Flavitalea sp.]|nr:SDR family NAD(P)-dependent oxidoreductase [Flavitalea sp.]
MTKKQDSKKPAGKKGMLAKNDRIAVISPTYRPSNKLENKVAIITGGDSGIGRSVALHYAKEGADIAIVYHQSD